MLSSTVTSKGQVTLPAKMRRETGIKPSDKVMFVRVGRKIEVEKIPPLESLFGSLANPKVKPLSAEGMKALVKKGMFGE